ncbi:hypothetical protein L207DRAFT_509225 [Hyaloscypha variabilis F]|uniref:Uncharacterized protein n=1 Tax=Hyaloscypha variabilis (strain UAMH 11265 / GT02V1 / F) TaxID=1149755 RepID=A0A2J6S159_HYAVF|nr:hypothetical protein L207DRAFT_509225 [Hyaloscypha variabilis F]
MKFSSALLVVLSAAMATLQGAAAAPVEDTDPGYHLGHCSIHGGHSICNILINDWSDYNDDNDFHRHCDPAAQCTAKGNNCTWKEGNAKANCT